MDNDFNWFICLGPGIVENTKPVVPAVPVTEEQGIYHAPVYSRKYNIIMTSEVKMDLKLALIVLNLKGLTLRRLQDQQQ